MDSMESEKGSDQRLENKISMSFLEKTKLKVLDKYNFTMICVLIFAFLIKMHYYLMTRTQTAWWDEAAYLVKAKSLAFPFYFQEIGRTLVEGAFNPSRSPIYPSMLAFFYKIGLSEAFFRLPSVFFSVGTVLLVYLVGKELFNKKVGIVAAIFAAVMWVDFYVVTRIFPDSMSIFFITLAIFLFVKGYIKKDHKYYTWAFLPMFAIACMVRLLNVLFLIILLVYLIITEREQILKNKDAAISFIFAGFASIPYFLYYFFEYGSPFFQIIRRISRMGANILQIEKAIQVDPIGTMVYFKLMPDYLVWPLLILFLVGLVLIMDFFLGLDLIWKRENKELTNKFFLFLWILVPFLFYGFVYTLYDQRYLMIVYPAVFIAAAYGVIKAGDLIRKYSNKIVAILIIALLISLVGYFNLSKADDLVKSKLDSQWQIKEAGLWIRNNSDPGDIIISRSLPQMLFYSERKIMGIPHNKTEFENNLNNMTQVPKYMVFAAFEQHLPWMFQYPVEHNDTWKPIMGYYATKDGREPVVVLIYEHSKESPIATFVAPESSEMGGSENTNQTNT